MSRTGARLVCVLLLAVPAALRAQTPTPTSTPTPTPTPAPNTIPSGQNWTTDGNAPVSGSRIAQTADGATWFLTASTDRIVRLQGGAMTQWPIREQKDIGANPVDFQLDGDAMWLIENGESLIDAGKSIIARFDTKTGALREWVLPMSRPAGFYRTPDGKKIWVAQTAGVLELVDLETLEVTDYRAGPTVIFAAGLALGPDGALWMIDFGSNRIVRHDLGDNTETAWTIIDPSQFALRLSDMRFDEDGFLWITEVSGGRVDRFDIKTGELRSYLGFANPLHLDLFGGNVYVSEETGATSSGANGRFAILDPRLAPYVAQTLTPVTLTVSPPLARPPAQVRDSVLAPVPFTPTNANFSASDLTVTQGAAGILHVEYNKVNAYGIAVSGGAVWVGSNGFLIRIVPQTVGAATDQTVPIALQRGTPPADSVRVDLTLYNRGSAALSGNALYQFSAGAFPQTKAFTVGPAQTLVLEDAFVGAPSAQSLVAGPVRFQVTAGQASDLVASVRSARRVDAGTFGFALPAQTSDGALQTGMVRTLFTATRPGNVSAFGYFSPTGGQALAELFAPDGTLRGSRTISIESNVVVEHNPAAPFFGATPEPGDVIRVTVTSGVLQPYVNVQDPVTRDVALSLPIEATTDAVLPNVASIPSGSAFWISSVNLSNPDATRPATVAATYYPIGSGTPVPASVTVPPGGTVAIGDAVADLFHASPGQGAVVFTSDAPVAIAQRLAAQSVADASQFSSQSPALSAGAFVPEGGATAAGVFATASRRTNLLLFNRGAAGTATITAFDGSGATVGQILLPVGDHAAARVNRVLETAGGSGVGRIRVEASAGMQVYAQTVDVDAGTGDTDLANLR